MNNILIGNKCDVSNRVRMSPPAPPPCPPCSGPLPTPEGLPHPVPTPAPVPAPSQAVSTEEGQALADKFSIPFFETSAKTDVNVTDVRARGPPLPRPTALRPDSRASLAPCPPTVAVDPRLLSRLLAMSSSAFPRTASPPQAHPPPLGP